MIRNAKSELLISVFSLEGRNPEGVENILFILDEGLGTVYLPFPMVKSCYSKANSPCVCMNREA